LIITKLIGGLGNQMFQYAVARCLAYLNQDELKLDISGFIEYPLRIYHLNCFNIVGQIALDEEINQAKAVQYVRESYFQFNSEILNLKGDLYLEGYWQSEKYFKDIENIIRKDFKIKNLQDAANLKMAEQIQNCESISVHVRRGDYVSNPETKLYHGICDIEYYRQTMEKVGKRIPRAHFFIFSDDHPWVKQTIESESEFPVTVVEVNDQQHPVQDLHLMSCCKHHIIANSTFSWWGAWLSINSERIVYAPQKWFNAAAHDTCDLLPDTWQRI
jgi:hypothetical protein